MGGCNCLRTNAINEELETTNNPKRELIKTFLEKDYAMINVLKLQARVRGILLRDKIRVRASKIKKRAAEVHNEEANELISRDDLHKLCEQYSSLKDDVTVVLRNGIKYDNQSVYYGEMNSKLNLRHGRGIQVMQDGSKYEGYFLHDKANAKGKLTYSNGNYYEGEWVNDKAEGNGIYRHVDGTEYKGQWKNNKQEGYGEERWPDGSIYRGNYINGNKSGHGIFKWIDGSVYEGDFADNRINGKGTYIWTNKNKYEGDWVNDLMEGKGVFTWPDNRQYEGEYRTNKKEGYGEFKWPDGRIYKGKWVNGKQEGRGEFFNPTTSYWKKGVWENGKRLKWIDEEE